MNRQCVMAVSFLGIAACATSGHELPGSAGEVVIAAESSKPASPDVVTEDADVPEVPKVAQIERQAEISDPDAIVCRQITRTGSHLQKRLCQTRSGIEQRRTADQRELERITERARIVVPPDSQ